MSELAASRLAMPVWQGFSSGALLFFGVALPIAALAVELTMHLNAQAFFDPLPTPFHVFAVAFVALANMWCWFVLLWRQEAKHIRWAARANGVAIGIATFYSVLFLPLLPLGAIGILFYALGALVWAPLSSLIVGLRLRVHLKRQAKEHDLSLRSWPGIVLGLSALIALDLPATITRIGARMAVGNSVETRARGLALLRAIGSERVLLRMCYVRSGSATDMLSFLVDLERPIDTREARQLYYRVTGNSFNSEEPPPAIASRGRFFDWGNVDFDQGIDAVGGRVTDLTLASSRLDGSVTADAALGYLEWTMVFRNSSELQREARAEIALPPGAVVSRLTLWINGEEREAAFAGRGNVRAAYESVVHKNRDPVLVTSAGPDRIAMQLFPVPPGGDMKVRVGMTVPLALDEMHEAVLRLPYFHERNFGIREELRHSVWIESKSKLHSALTLTADPASGIVRAEIDDARLASSDASIFAPRNEQNGAWSPDTHAAGQVVRQVISEEPARRPPQLVIVVDGSRSMRDVASQVAKNLEAIPADVKVRLIFAHDESERSTQVPLLSAAEAAKEVASFRYVGGNDNTAALVRGIDLAFEQPDSVLLWIHGPQPERLDAVENLLQRLERGPKLSRWYDLQVSPGPNFIAGSMDGVVGINTLRDDDVPRIVTAWRTGKWLPTVHRERVEASAAALLPASERTSDHLVRLWANDEIARLIYSKPDRRAEAVSLAHEYQLVTPVSGAVVLETQQQYDANGLQPVPAGTVPSIPEPEEWALMIVALMVLAYAYRRRHALFSARAA